VDEVISPETIPHGKHIIVKISHYDPNLGGTNCASWYDDYCHSKMSNGERWEDYIEKNDTIACPKELPFGTIIWIEGNNYVCRDRGGAITITPEGYYWIDILANKVSYKYGETREAILVHWK